MSKRHLVLGIGSNIQPLLKLRQALFELKNNSVFQVLKISSIYESNALLPESAPPEWEQKFLNAAVLCQTEESDLEQILIEIKNIEKKLGRIPSQRWAPRFIDIDLLWAEGERYQSNTLNVPHLELFKRPFALCPAVEVCPAILKLEKDSLPSWIWGQQEKPFATQRSEKYFWPQFVGILNLTTDSFSDGGLYLDEEKFIAKAQQLIGDGAEVLDLGAESTRPGALKISIQQEIERLEQALSWIEKHRLKIHLSIDSRNFETQNHLLSRFPIQYVNDVSGLSDFRMLELLKKHPEVKSVVMHSLTIPADPQVHLPLEIDLSVYLCDWWKQILKKAESEKILSDRLIFDPGIGFGKTANQSWDILKNLSAYQEIKNDIYLGFSRKSFLKTITSAEPADRDAISATVFSHIPLLYCQYLRVHDVQSHVQALKVKYAVNESI